MRIFAILMIFLMLFPAQLVMGAVCADPAIDIAQADADGFWTKEEKAELKSFVIENRAQKAPGLFSRLKSLIFKESAPVNEEVTPTSIPVINPEQGESVLLDGQEYTSKGKFGDEGGIFELGDKSVKVFYDTSLTLEDLKLYTQLMDRLRLQDVPIVPMTAVIIEQDGFSYPALKMPFFKDAKPIEANSPKAKKIFDIIDSVSSQLTGENLADRALGAPGFAKTARDSDSPGNILSVDDKIVVVDPIKMNELLGVKDKLRISLLPATKEEIKNKAEIVIKRTISEPEANALLAAHFTGEDHYLGTQNPDGTYNKHNNPKLAYTQDELREKSKILKSAGFYPAERRALIEYGIAGKEFRKKVKELLSKEYVESKDEEFLSILSNQDIADLKGMLSKSDFKKLSKLMNSLSTAIDTKIEGPKISEKEYEKLREAFEQFIELFDSSLTEQPFRDVPIAFILQGSLVTGWSDYHDRPSDHQGIESDADILIVVQNDYWDAIPEFMKEYLPIPMTQPLEQGGYPDPALLELSNILSQLTLAGKKGRDVNFRIIPMASFRNQEPLNQRQIYSSHMDLSEVLKKKQVVLDTAVELTNC